MAKTIMGSIVSLDGFIADDNRHFLERLGLLLGGRDPPRRAALARRWASHIGLSEAPGPLASPPDPRRLLSAATVRRAGRAADPPLARGA